MAVFERYSPLPPLDPMPSPEEIREYLQEREVRVKLFLTAEEIEFLRRLTRIQLGGKVK